jgi:hypothetical protein
LEDNEEDEDAEAGARACVTGPAALPRLTHLALPYYIAKIHIPILSQLLEACKSLCALAVLQPPPVRPPNKIALFPKHDVRLVVLQVGLHHEITNWQPGALTGVDCWERADRLIAMQNSGDVSRESHHYQYLNLSGFIGFIT